MSLMSLKAKIEAVIYAAEEPVTLQQLASLLGQEAQAELDHLAAAQHRLPLHDDGDVHKSAGALQPRNEVVSDDDVRTLRELLDADDPARDDASPATPQKDGLMADRGGASGHAAEPAAALSGHDGSPSSDEPPSSVDALPEPSPLDERRLAREAKERDRTVREYFRRLLDELIRDYAIGDRGLEIREVANGFRLATKPEYHDTVRGFAKSLKPPLKLTLQALETLAVVAYKQPITAPEVSEIRGVDSGGVLGSLMARKLVTPAGRKQVIGRPILYKTTKDFLLRFGLKDIGELPSIEEFEKMAGELQDNDAVQEEIPMADPQSASQDDVVDANLREEEDATEPQADGDSRAADALPVDGRMSGASAAAVQLNSVDPSAEEAAIQNDEAAARHEGQE